MQNTGGSTIYNLAVSDNRILSPAKVNCPSNTLASGAAMTCTSTYTVRAGDVGGNGILVNTAVATGQTGIGQQVTSNQSNAQINVFTDVGVTKTVDNSAPMVGSDVTFTVTATNHGPSLAQDVVITDLLASDRLAFVSAAPAVGTTYDPATGRWGIPSLAVGGSVSLTIVATVQTNTGVSNSATRTAMRQTDINPANDTASVTLNPVPTVDLAVSKSVDNADVPIGDQVRFTIRVTNNGPSPAFGVALSDVLPASLVFDPAASSGDGTYDPTTGVWAVGDLAVSASASYTIVVTTTALGTYTNLVSLQAVTPSDNNSSNNTGSASITVRDRNADLYVTKAVYPEATLVDEEIVYQLEIGNKGPEAALGVFVSDFAPDGVDLSATVTPNVVVSKGSITFQPDGTIRWDVGDMAVNDIEQATVYAVLREAGTKINTSTIDAPNLLDPNPGDNSDTAQVTSDPRPLDIVVTKDVEANSGAPIDAVPLGDEVTFRITATNDGPNGASNVELLDVLDPALSVVTATPSAGTYDPTTGVWALPTLAVDEQVTLEVVATATEVGQHSNTIALRSLDQVDTDPSNNSASAAIVVVNEADLAITKDVDPVTAQPGDEVHYTVTVTNGPNDATDVTAHDPLIIEADITDVDVPAGTSFDSTTRVWTIGELAVRESVTLSATVAVSPDPGVFTNTVAVSTSGLPDPDMSNNIDTATLFVPAADITVSKAVRPAQAVVGEEITFLVQISNLGPDPATAVVVADLLPPGLTLVSAVPSSGTYDPATGQWSIGDLEPVRIYPMRAAEQHGLTLVARADQPGTYTNTAVADRTGSFPFDPIAANNRAEATVQVTRGPADLTLSKSASPSQVAVGGTIVFSLRARNLGPATAENVRIADVVPAGLTPTATSDPGCTISGQDVVCTRASLAVGATWAIDITTIAATAGSFTNAATVSSANPDPDPTTGVGSAAGEVLAALPPTPLPDTGGSNPVPTLTIAAFLVAAGLVMRRATRAPGR